MPGFTRTLLTAGSLLAAGSLVGSCGLLGDDPPLVVIGDSISNQDAEALRNALGDYDVRVEAVDGATIQEQMGAAREAADPAPDVVVVNLGTNDSTRRSPTIVADMEQMLGLFPDSCRVAVTVTESRVEPGVPESAQELNTYLRDGAEQGEWLLADWDLHVKQYLEAGETDGPLTHDTIHPTAMGRVRLAQLVEDAVGDCQ